MFNSGAYKLLSVRASAILTNGYVAGTVIGPTTPQVDRSIDTEEYNTLVILAAFTKGSLTDTQIKVEFSPDGTTYYQETTEAVAAGVATMSPKVYLLGASGNYAIKIPMKAHWVKISAIGTGTLTSSLLQLDAIVGWS